MIEDDPEFSKRLSDAIKGVRIKKFIEVPAMTENYKILSSCAIVIETHHADYYQLILVGGNTAQILGLYPSYNPELIVRELADKLGFRLVKKTTRKRE